MEEENLEEKPCEECLADDEKLCDHCEHCKQEGPTYK
jgi:hypothetical protein